MDDQTNRSWAENLPLQAHSWLEIREPFRLIPRWTRLIFDRRGLGKYPSEMKVNEILRMLHADGWFLVTTRGSHRQYRHASKTGRVTVPGKPSDDLALGTLNSIQKQAQLKK